MLIIIIKGRIVYLSYNSAFISLAQFDELIVVIDNINMLTPIPIPDNNILKYIFDISIIEIINDIHKSESALIFALLEMALCSM